MAVDSPEFVLPLCLCPHSVGAQSLKSASLPLPCCPSSWVLHMSSANLPCNQHPHMTQL